MVAGTQSIVWLRSQRKARTQTPQRYASPRQTCFWFGCKRTEERRFTFVSAVRTPPCVPRRQSFLVPVFAALMFPLAWSPRISYPPILCTAPLFSTHTQLYHFPPPKPSSHYYFHEREHYTPAPTRRVSARADNRALSAELAFGDEHLLGPAAHHLPKGPDQLQTPHQQARQRQGQGAEGQRKLLLHGRDGLIFLIRWFSED